LDGKAYFCGAAYHIRGGFGTLRSFLEAIPMDLAALPYDGDAVLEATTEAVQQLRHAVGARVTSESASAQVMIRDLEAIRSVLQQEGIRRQLDERKDLDAVLARRVSELNGLLASAGMSDIDVPVFVVDRFPAPYEERRFAVLAADGGDETAYGVTPGLYFLREGLRPFYSEFLMCHEIIHVILGMKHPELIAHGLEEGLADILGSVLFSRRLLGEDLTRNIFIYNRLGSDYDALWEQYLDFARAAAWLHGRFGLSGLLEMLHGGRALLKTVENQLLHAEMQAVDLPASEPDNADLQLIDYLTLVFPRATVTSPLAKYIAHFVTGGATTREIFKISNIGPEDGLAALRELEQGFNLLGLRQDGSVVIWSECEMYSDFIRYRL